MLYTLFNSQQKIRVLQFLFSKPNISFTPSEIASVLRSRKILVSRTLSQLTKSGVLKRVPVHGKKRKEHGYHANESFILFSEIRALFLKSQLLVEGDLIKKIKKLGGVSLTVLTGIFTGGHADSQTDILIVGKINKKKIAMLIKSFEKKLHLDIRYTTMSKSEYAYRKDITDRFLYTILEGNMMIVIDTMKESI